MNTQENVLVGDGQLGDIYQSWQPWLVCLTAGLFFFYAFVLMNMFNAISVDLMRAFHINAVQLGNLSASFLYADALFLLPAGLILDRFSTRKVILYAMAVCIVSALGFALSHNLLLAGFFHFIGGIANAFCFLSCIMLAARWFPPKRMALIVGIIVTMAMAGGMLAQTPLALLNHALGWRSATLVIAGLGVAIMGLIWLVVQDAPKGQKIHRADMNFSSFFTSLKSAASNKQNWLCGTYTSLLNLPIMLLGAVWGDLYLTQVHHFSVKSASSAVGMIFLGTIVGAPLAGWISDKLGVRKLPMIVGAIISLVLFFIFMYTTQLSTSYAAVLLFAIGFFTSTQVIAYPAVAESNTSDNIGTATGLASTLIMGGAAIAQPLFGWVLNLGWDGAMQHHAPLYSSQNFLSSLMIIPVGFVIALIAVFMVRETYCKTLAEK